MQDWRQGKLALQTDISPAAAGLARVETRSTFVPPWRMAALIVITAALGTMAYAGYATLDQPLGLAWSPTGWMAGADAGLPPAEPPTPRADGEAQAGEQTAADEPPKDGAGPVASQEGPPASDESGTVSVAKLTAEPSTPQIAPDQQVEPAHRRLPIDGMGAATSSERQAALTSPPPASGSFALQVASVRKGAVATTWQRLLARFPTELAGLELRPARAPRTSRSAFYPVIAGTFATRAEAQAACDQLRAAGGECLVIEDPG